VSTGKRNRRSLDCNALLGSIPRTNRRVPHISLVFRQMWDTAGFPLKSVTGPTTPYGCPTFASAYVGRKQWAKPTTAFGSGYRLLLRIGTKRSGEPAFFFAGHILNDLRPD
jgi:hypothetical protein